MKKVYLLVVGALISISSLDAQIDVIKVKGSDALYNVLKTISTNYQNEIKDSLLKVNNNKPLPYVIDVSGQGSTLGIQYLQEGLCDIASSSREMSKEEKDVFVARGKKLQETRIAKEAIVVIVNDKNPLQHLTQEQVKAIFTGKVTNWKDVFSKSDLDKLLASKVISKYRKDMYKNWIIDQPIKKYIRSNTSGCYMGFKTTFMNEKEYSSSCLMMPNNHSIKKAINDHINGISFLGYFEAVDEINKTFKFEMKTIGLGYDTASFVKPTKENILLSKYPFTRDCYLYYDEANKYKVRHFVNYVLKDTKGQVNIQQMGFIPNHYIE